MRGVPSDGAQRRNLPKPFERSGASQPRIDPAD
jgi:hypothetical protein